MRYVIIFLLIFAAAHPAQANIFDPCNPADYSPIAQTYKTGLFFRISKCVDGKKIRDSYLLGTMHSDLPQVRSALPRSVWQVLGQAKSASFELKEDSSMQASLIKAMYYDTSSGTNLRSITGDEMYTKLKQTLDGKRSDLAEAVYEKMRPWAVALLMQVPADEVDGVHLDMRLEKYAADKAIPVFGLETVDEQLGVFTTLSQAEQVGFLQEAIDTFDETEKMNDKMLDSYLRADLTGLQKLAVQAFDMMENVLLRDKLKETLITKRNLHMVERMQPRLADGNAFIAVGALHLPAEEGLLNLLEQGGYYIHVVND